MGYDTIMLNQLVALSRIHRYKGKGSKGTLLTNIESDMQTLVIYKFGVNQSYCTFT